MLDLPAGIREYEVVRAAEILEEVLRDRTRRLVLFLLILFGLRRPQGLPEPVQPKPDAAARFRRVHDGDGTGMRVRRPQVNRSGLLLAWRGHA